MRLGLIQRARGNKLKRYPGTQGIFGEDVRTSLAPPRSRPHAPNVHFDGNDYGNKVTWGSMPDQLPAGIVNAYKRRYGEPTRVGREKFDGSYTGHMGTIPVYRRRSIPEHLKAHIDSEKELEMGQGWEKPNKKHLEWYRNNWTELDLVDPAKWAIFPGDIVCVVNPNHKDHKKYGVVTEVYIPHGLVWVSGVNLSRPMKMEGAGGLEGIEDYAQGFHSSDVNSVFKAVTLPFNYRDVKLLRFGHKLYELSSGEASSGYIDEELMEWVTEFKSSPQNLKNFSKELLNWLEKKGYLETVNARMTYSNFDYDNFSLMSWTDLGASRACCRTDSRIALPEKRLPGYHTDEGIPNKRYNEIASEDYTTINKQSVYWEFNDDWKSGTPWHREERENKAINDKVEILKESTKVEVHLDHEEADREPKLWQQIIRGEKFKEDEHIFQCKPLP